MRKTRKPPRLAEWILRRIFPDCENDTSLGDFEEVYRTLAEESGSFRAGSWYWLQVILSVKSFIFGRVYWGCIMANGYIKITARRFSKEKGCSIINLTGLAVGMAVFLLAFLYLHNELSVDRFHEKADRTYRLIMEQHQPNHIIHSACSPAPAGPALCETFPEIINYTRYSHLFGEVLLSHRDKRFYESRGAYGDPGFFKIFTVKFTRGNPETVFEKLHSIVLSESLAEKYFGDENPIGKTLELENAFDLTVMGVFEDIPGQSHLQFDYMIPYKLQAAWGANLKDWNNWGLQYTYLLLQKNLDIREINRKIGKTIQRHLPESQDLLYLQPLKEIYLSTDITYDTYAYLGDRNIILSFFMTGMIILIIASINFVNLTTARSIKRAQEIGLRKVIGANRLQLIRQFIGESFIFSLLALLFAVLLVQLMLPAFNDVTGKQLTIGFSNKGILIGFCLTLMFTGFGAGFYPAVLLSSYKPASALKGMPSLSKRHPLRRVLVVIQFFLSIVLIIFTLTIRKQLNYLLNKELGFDKESIVYAQMQGTIRREYELLKKNLLENQNILSVSSGSSFSTIYQKTTEDADWEGKEEEESRILFASIVDYDFLKTFNIELVQGRDFSKEFSTDEKHAFIINEKAAALMGFKNPIGKELSFNGETGLIIGVVKDYHYLSLHQRIEPLIISIRNEWRLMIFIKIDSEDISGTISTIQKTWGDIAPDIPFEYRFWDDTLDRQYSRERKTKEIFHYFTLLAIFISCMGLFGLASFMTEQRTKEIGIRKVLGARESGLFMLLSKEFVKWVIVANLAAWPVAWLAVREWLQGFAYRAPIGVWPFLLATVTALVIAMMTVTFHSVKAARANPIEALRYE